MPYKYKEDELAYNRFYYQMNKEWISIRKKHYYQNNKEWCLIYNKKWRENNPDYMKIWGKKHPNYFKNRYLRNKTFNSGKKLGVG